MIISKLLMIRNLSVMKNIQSDFPQEHLIFALDETGGIEETLHWVKRLRGHVGMFKIGKEAFTLYGPKIVAKIHEQGEKVFLDLKFHDIPHTVARASEAAVGMGVAMFNMHALGGKRMLREAVTAARRKAENCKVRQPIILAVTVLTSLNDDDLRQLGFRSSAEDITLELAKMAQDEGVSGVVASPQDIVAIRKACGPDFILVTPGIRGRGAEGDDQKRTLSAGEAIARGADYLVLGRPIRQAPDPAKAADDLIREIAAF